MSSRTNYASSFNKLILRYWLTALALFLLAGIAGVLVRYNQVAPFLTPSLHYSLMTFHGVAMFGFIIVALIGAGWLLIAGVLNNNKPTGRIELVYWLFIVGAVSIVVAVFLGKFAGAFPPLPPLPVRPAGGWPLWASAVFLGGVLILLIGALLFFIEWLVAAHKAVGGIGEALGVGVFSKRTSSQSHTTPTIVAVTAASLVGVMAIIIGAYLQGNIFFKLLNPAYQLDAMMAKNALWMFGHTLANLLFWGVFGIVYLFVTIYTGKEWKAYPLLVAAWLTTMVTTGLTAFLHHVQMDFAIPFGLLIFGQVATYISGVPWAAISVYGAMTRIWGSGMEWKPAMRFIYLGLFCFVIGAVAAFMDATLGFNRVLHNTLWVPAHFHSYMMLGSTPFLMAAMYHYLPQLTGKPLGASRLPSVHFWLTLVGGIGILVTFYLAGLLNAPRRFADVLSIGLPAGIDPILTISVPFACLFGLGQVIFIYYVVRAVFGKAK